MASAVTTKAAAVSNSMAPYLGQHLRVVDHGRVILPVEWRPKVRSQELMVMSWPVMAPEYLLVLPPARWEILLQNLQELSLTNEEGAEVQRLISSSACMKSLDRYGRLPLPEDAAKRLGIESEAMLVGGVTKFEVWNSSRFSAAIASTNKERAANTLKSLNL